MEKPTRRPRKSAETFAWSTPRISRGSLGEIPPGDDLGDPGLGGPSVVLATGLDKPFQIKLSDPDFNEVLELVAESRKRPPRSVLR